MVTPLSLAGGARRGETGYINRLAPQSVPLVLAMEVQGWKHHACKKSAVSSFPKMVRENPTLGRPRISPNSIEARHLPVSPYGPSLLAARTIALRTRAADSQHWRTFIRNHAQSIVACDFFVAVFVRFQVLYVLVVMEIGTRRILHCNITTHPTAAWTIQQMREAIPSDHFSTRFLIHDRDGVFSAELDQQVSALELRVLRTPVRAPQANAYCERLVGTIRRECCDYVIPLSARHLLGVLREFLDHYNRRTPTFGAGTRYS